MNTLQALWHLPGALLRAMIPGRPEAALRETYDGRLIEDDEVRLASGRELVQHGYGQVVPAMSAAIQLLSTTMACLPRYVTDANGEPVMDHPVTQLLNRNHRRWPATAVWEYLYRSALHFGVGFAWIVRQGGQAIRILPCDPVSSTYRLSADRTRYVCTLHPVIGRMRTEVPVTDVLLVIGDGYNGIQGLSPVSAYGVTVGVLRHANQHLLSTLVNGAHFGGVVESDVEVGAGMGWDLPRVAELRKELVKLFAGTLKAGGVPVMPPGFKFSPVPYNAVDIELIKLLELSIEDICRVYRVPPRLIYHFRSGIRYANDAEQSNTEFARYSIQPRADLLGDMTASQLLSARALNQDGLGVRFETDQLYAGTLSQRIASVDQGVARAGILTVNEGREYVRTGRLPRLTPVPDGDRLLDPKGAPTQTRENPGNTPPGEETGEG